MRSWYSRYRRGLLHDLLNRTIHELEMLLMFFDPRFDTSVPVTREGTGDEARGCKDDEFHQTGFSSNWMSNISPWPSVPPPAVAVMSASKKSPAA